MSCADLITFIDYETLEGLRKAAINTAVIMLLFCQFPGEDATCD